MRTQTPWNDAEAILALDRHQRRRGQGIPTLTVLSGPPGAGVAAWLRWTSLRGLSFVGTRAVDEAGLARAWLEDLAARRALTEDAMAYLETSEKPGALAQRLRGHTAYERSVLLNGLFPSAPRGPLRACRALLELETPSRSAVADAVLAAFAEAPGEAIKAVAALLPEEKVPSLLILGGMPGGLARTARAAARLCAALPTLAVALAVDPAELEACLREPSGQIHAFLREGQVSLPAMPLDVFRERLAKAGVEANEAWTATVGRLREDGVPESLLWLFREAAQPTSVERGRSHAERFLFGVLESLAWSRGLFELNGQVSLPDGRHCEVDFLSRGMRIALELDGYFHFQEAERYRRDRRKDLDLQRQGYLVVRFLSEDVVSRLETLLNTLQELISIRMGPEGPLREETREHGGT